MQMGSAILVFLGKRSNLAELSEFPLNPRIRPNLVPENRRRTKNCPPCANALIWRFRWFF
jgi:hypothetical protein